MSHDDDIPRGHVLARREVLTLLGASAGAAALARWLPAPGPDVAWAQAPGCVVRPAATEGPYFVDEKLLRSDIRSDPSDGSMRDGALLALTFTVSATDGTRCVPFPGVLVDLWHCDAAGVYAGVQDPSFDTTGKKFLRGYQVTDAAGIARFITIWPGWYPGRAVHLHWKLRTDPAAATARELTSQLYFEDSFTDAVHAQAPYAARGQRTLRNGGDFIYQQQGGAQLLLAPTADGTGGYAATFDVALAVDALPGATTSTTIAGGGCTTIAACLAALLAALPDPATAATRRARRVAQRLRQRGQALSGLVERAATASGGRRSRRWARARAKVRKLVAAGEAAEARGVLGVPLATLQLAGTALGALLPD